MKKPGTQSTAPLQTHTHNLTDLSWDQQWRESLEEVKKGLPAAEEVERELGNRENDE